MKKIVFLLILILFPFKINANACVEIPSFKVVPSEEKGNFIFEKSYYNQFLVIDRTKYPNTEFFINNELFGDITKDNNIYIDLRDKYSKPLFPSKINVSVKQNGKEIYSAKWKVYDTSEPNPLDKKVGWIFGWLILNLLFLLALSLTKIKKNLKIKYFLTFCVLMFFLLYYSSRNSC